jgi:beta-glucanase (GH16 family)
MKKFVSLRASVLGSLTALALVLAACSGREDALFAPAGGPAGTGGDAEAGLPDSGGGSNEAGPASDGAADTSTNDADGTDAEAGQTFPDSSIADAPDDAVDARPPECPSGVLGHCSSASYPEYPGFTLKLVEDFDEPLDLLTDPNWTYSDGMPDSAYTRFARQAISFAGGKALITATKPSGGVVGSGYPTYADGTVGLDYPKSVDAATVQSGELRTKYNNWRYGRFEARVKAALNSNVVNAFFTFRSPRWQDWRSLTFELTPANSPSRVGTNIVYGNSCAGYIGCTLNAYTTSPVLSLAGGGTIYDAFHTYTIENMPAAVKWYVDDVLIRTETSNLPEKSMKIMLDLYVFGSALWGGGTPADNTYPMSMQIDWVRLYKADVDAAYPCSPLPVCQPAEDRDYQKNNAEDGLPAAAPW